MASIHKTSHNTYRVSYRDNDGNQHAPTFPTREEAVKFSKLVEAKKVQGELEGLKLSKQPLSHFYQQWIEALDRSPSTIRDYRSCYRRHVEKPLGSRPVGSISEFDVRVFLNRLPIAPESRRGVLKVLRGVLTHAEVSGALRRDPTRSIQVPVPRSRAWTTLTPAQIHELATLCGKKNGGPYDTAVLLAAGTGLRANELWDLTSKDVSNGWLRPAISKTKTGQDRPIPIPPGLILPDRDGYLFRNTFGYRVNHRTFMIKVFRPACKKLKLESLRFHDLRHTYATLMVQNGVNPKLLQQRLGHASFATTMDVYGHLFPGELTDADKALGSLIRPCS